MSTPGGAPLGLAADKVAAALRQIKRTTATKACPPRDLTKELVADLRRIDAKIKTNEGQMRDALAATTTTVPQVHGIGIVLAAQLLGAMSSPVEVGAEDLGADPLCVLDPVALTHIDGQHRPAALVVAHCIRFPHRAADEDSRAAGRPLPGAPSAGGRAPPSTACPSPSRP